MSKFPKFTILLVAASLIAAPAFAGKLGLGRAALPEEIAAWNRDIEPDGTGLPVGSGDALVGEEIFAEKCAACHGDFAEGIDNWPKLAGGAGTLDREDPLKTVGSYWPHLSTAFDYIRRSMPYGNAGTLSDDEVYAIVAYILYSNDLIEDDWVLSNETFLDVEMPNADGFIVDNRAETEYGIWSGEPCMTNCKAEVKVTMRALVLDVTPDIEIDQEDASAPAEPTETPAETPTVAVAAYDAELAAQGEKVFNKCKSCHQVGSDAKNKTGPILTGILDSPAGAVDGFRYSKAIGKAADAGLVWNEAELSAFLAKPKSYLKGTKMSFSGLKSEEDRVAIIEYFKSLDD